LELGNKIGGQSKKGTGRPVPHFYMTDPDPATVLGRCQPASADVCRGTRSKVQGDRATRTGKLSSLVAWIEENRVGHCLESCLLLWPLFWRPLVEAATPHQKRPRRTPESRSPREHRRQPLNHRKLPVTRSLWKDRIKAERSNQPRAPTARPRSTACSPPLRPDANRPAAPGGSASDSAPRSLRSSKMAVVRMEGQSPPNNARRTSVRTLVPN
jgi:hypothetical protein